MMAAVVAVVDSNGPPPPELSLAWQVERWGTLPEAGGLYDQDYATISRMTGYGNVYNTVSKLRNMKGAEIHSLTHSERKIIGILREIEAL